MEYMLSYLFSEIFFTCFGRVNRQDYVSYFILMKMDGFIFCAIVSEAGAHYGPEMGNFETKLFPVKMLVYYDIICDCLA